MPTLHDSLSASTSEIIDVENRCLRTPHHWIRRIRTRLIWYRKLSTELAFSGERFRHWNTVYLNSTWTLWPQEDSMFSMSKFLWYWELDHLLEYGSNSSRVWQAFSWPLECYYKRVLVDRFWSTSPADRSSVYEIVAARKLGWADVTCCHCPWGN